MKRLRLYLSAVNETGDAFTRYIDVNIPESVLEGPPTAENLMEVCICKMMEGGAPIGLTFENVVVPAAPAGSAPVPAQSGGAA